MEKTTFAIGDLVSYAWNKTLSHFWFVGTVTFCFLLISAVLDQGNNRHPSIIIGIAQLLVMIVQPYLFLKMSLMIVHDQTPTAKEVFDINVKTCLLLAVGTLVFGFAQVIGLLLFIVPGLIITIRFCIWGQIYMDQKVPLKDAFIKSWNITKGHFWDILGLFVVMLLINLAGVLFFVVGLLISIPMTAIIFARLYSILNAALIPAQPAPTQVISAEIVK